MPDPDMTNQDILVNFLQLSAPGDLTRRLFFTAKIQRNIFPEWRDGKGRERKCRDLSDIVRGFFPSHAHEKD